MDGNMKKIYLSLIAVAIVIVCGRVFADPVTTTRKVNPQPQTPYTYTKPTQKTQTPVTRKQTSSALANSVKTCKPYSENLDSSMGGVDFNFKVKIDGWVNNKCVLNFTAQSTGINSMFKSIYGVDASDAQIYTFEPKIRCEFTKQQLEYVGDSILQEQQRNSGATNNMLKHPDEISISSNNMSASDARLLDVVINQGACKILNGNDINKMIESLF